MKKKLLVFLILLVTVIATVAVVSASADELPDSEVITSENAHVELLFTKNVDGETYTVTIRNKTGYTGSYPGSTGWGPQKSLFEKYKSVTTKIIVDQSITDIGNILGGFTKVTQVILPENPQFTAISSGAFSASAGEIVTIPEGIVTIGDSAFSTMAGSLRGVTTKEVHLPSTIASILEGNSSVGFGSKYGNELYQITIYGKNDYAKHWAISNGATYVDEAGAQEIGTSGVYYAYTEENTTLTLWGKGAVPDFTAGSAPWADVADDVTMLVILDGVTGIGNYAFYGFTALEDASLPASVATVGTNAFGLAAENEDDFFVEVRNNDCDVSGTACANRNGAVVLQHPNYAQSGLCGCKQYGTVVTDFARYYITLGSNSTLVVFGTDMVAPATGYSSLNENISKIHVANGIRRMANSALSNLFNVKWEDVHFPETLLVVRGGVMQQFSSSLDLSTLTLPKNLKAIDGCGFGFRSACVTNVYFENPNTSFDIVSFNYGALVTPTLTYRNNGENCTVKTLAKQFGITAIDLDVVGSGSIVENNITYEYSDGSETLIRIGAIDPSKPIIIPTSGAWLSAYSADKWTKIIIEDNVTAIPANAFSGYSGLTSVVLGQKVETIGENAFALPAENSASQMAIEITRSVTTIADSAFTNRNTKVYVPADSEFADMTGDNITVQKTFKVLFVGNSYCVDASDYDGKGNSMTYKTFQSLLGSDVAITFGLDVAGGKNMAYYVQQSQSGLATISYTETKNGTSWLNDYVAYCTVEQTLDRDNWDVIILEPFELEENVTTSLRYMLDLIEEYSPASIVYTTNNKVRLNGYSTIEADQNATVSLWQKYRDWGNTAATSTSTDGTIKVAGVIPIATAIQNGRTTYLTTISYSKDLIYGFIRDGIHSNYYFGRYIVGYTVAQKVIPSSIKVQNPTYPIITASKNVGAMPAEYAVICRAAADAALANPNQITSFTATYGIDPTVKAETAVNTLQTSAQLPDVVDTTTLATAIETVAKNALTNGEKDDLTVTVTDGKFDLATGVATATVSLKYGFVTKTVNLSTVIETAECEVTFDMQGHGTQVTAQTVYEDDYATEPTAPTADGYVFGGWYKEAGCTTPWNFETDTVTENTILYAKWTQTKDTYTVTFDMKSHGTQVSAQEIALNGKVTKPADPKESGYHFCGWYKEAGCTIPWNFENDTVTENTILYAKWIQVTGKAVIGETQYETLAEAISAATKDDTIVLYDNVTNIDYLVLDTGKTLDLNGYDVSVNKLAYVTGAIKDTATDKGVLTAVNYFFAENQKYTPIYNEKANGYAFYNLSFGSKTKFDAETNTVEFALKNNETTRAAYAQLLANDTSMRFKAMVTLGWTDANGVRIEQNFLYSDKMTSDAFKNTTSSAITVFQAKVTDVTANGVTIQAKFVSYDANGNALITIASEVFNVNIAD